MKLGKPIYIGEGHFGRNVNLAFHIENEYYAITLRNKINTQVVNPIYNIVQIQVLWRISGRWLNLNIFQ